MIDRDTFSHRMRLLAGRFPGYDLRGEVVAEYYRRLGPELSTEDFELACDHLFTWSEFFPSPGAFLEAAQGDLDSQAAAEWTGALKSSSWASNGRQSVNRYPFSDRGRFAWDSLGGAARVGNAEERDLDFLRREFVRRYVSASKTEMASATRRVSSGKRHGLMGMDEAVRKLGPVANEGSR